MIPTIAPGNLYQGLGYYRSTGCGATSKKLSEILYWEGQALFQLSVSLRAKFEAACDLTEMYKNCSKANWDGEGAEPISEPAYLEAARFIRLLPVVLPMPEIAPEPNGQIGLEWHLRRDHMFVVAFGGNQLITFAGLFGPETRVHGTEPFSDSLPESVITHLQRLLGK